MKKENSIKVLITAGMCFLFLFTGSGDSFSTSEDIFAAKRQAMVNGQIMARGIDDKQVLQAMTGVERHLFVPEELIDEAYNDIPLPIGYGQTISQPYIVAYMTAAISPGKDDVVLEIGTGCGYQTAVLADIVKKVYTIEILKPLADSARTRLKNLGYDNVEVKYGDGYNGWPEHAPFDAIIVTAAPPHVPEELVSQLKVGGKMIVPVGVAFQELSLIIRTETGVEKTALLPVRFVPMVHAEEDFTKKF